jgi:glycosyltransferase involved in cell wall biosynthesis
MREILKVCMLVLNPFTHDTRVLKEASTLASAGFDVTVWALKTEETPHLEEMHAFRVKRARQRLLNLPVRPPGLVYLETMVKMTVHLIQEDADVYHAHDAKALPACYLASRLRHTPLIYDAHEFLLDAGGSNWRGRFKSKLWSFFERLLIQQSDGVITVNVSIAQELARLYDIHPIVLMNCQEYVDTPRNNVLREELNISSEDRIAIYPGIFAPGRGLKQLIQGAKYLDRVVVVLMGPDKLEGKLHQMVQDLGVEDSVRIRAPVPPEDVPRYVASADIGIVPTQAIRPSYYYSSENKIFHYLAAGIPAAVSDHPEKRRIVETYDVGAVFDETDPKSIAQTINRLLNNEDRYQQMCRNAKEAARTELNWHREEQKLITLYRSLEAEQ